MQAFLIINAFQKLADAGARFVKIAVFVSVNLLVFQRFHKGFTGRIGRVRQLQRMPTVPKVLLKSPIPIIR